MSQWLHAWCVAGLAFGAVAVLWMIFHQKRKYSEESRDPESVNYHFTRQCNYGCGFCFHTAKTSFVLPLEEAKCGLRLLKNAGTVYTEMMWHT